MDNRKTTQTIYWLYSKKVCFDQEIFYDFTSIFKNYKQTNLIK